MLLQHVLIPDQEYMEVWSSCSEDCIPLLLSPYNWPYRWEQQNWGWKTKQPVTLQVWHSEVDDADEAYRKIPWSDRTSPKDGAVGLLDGPLMRARVLRVDGAVWIGRTASFETFLDPLQLAQLSWSLMVHSHMRQSRNPWKHLHFAKCLSNVLYMCVTCLG